MDPFEAKRPETDDGDNAAPESPADEDAPPAGQAPAQSEGFSNVGQETAELDMRTVLEDESGQDATPAGPIAAAPIAARPPSSGTSQERGAADDSLEWEMPGDAAAGGSDERR